jgi:endonuclease/exonuclease/phosphatase family metal-dependent hydrolase
MRIATWNLESVHPLTTHFEEAIRKVIYGIDADVWIITETWLNFSLVGYQLVAQSGLAEDLIHAKRPFSRWVAIWSRLRARQLEVLSDPERMACIRVEEENRPVVIVGTVLPWGDDNRHAPQKTTPDAASADFCQMLQVQSEEWRHLWSTPDSTGFCVAGDFNQQSLFFPNPQGNKRHVCINHAFKGLDCLTNNMKVVYPKAQSHLNPHPTIDHICVGGGLKLLAGTTPTTWDVPAIGGTAITDHAGVTADLDF